MIHIVDDTNNGKIVNELFNQRSSIKTEQEYKDWSEKVAATKFGTYHNMTILDVMKNFTCKFPNEIAKRDFIREVNDVYRSKQIVNIFKL